MISRSFIFLHIFNSINYILFQTRLLTNMRSRSLSRSRAEKFEKSESESDKESKISKSPRRTPRSQRSVLDTKNLFADDGAIPGKFTF